MRTFDDFYGRDLTLWNTLSGEIQIAIGLALMSSRRLVKPALTVSFGWAIFVWWFGEGFGGLTSNTLPAPLMGAPGAVILYAIIGLLVWPTEKKEGRSPAALGPLGDRGGLCFWSGLWVVSAGLWLVNVNRAKEATHGMIAEMAEASPHWLASVQNSLAKQTVGHGTTIAVVLAVVSVAVAVGVWTPLRWPALAIGIVLSLAYWLYGRISEGRSGPKARPTSTPGPVRAARLRAVPCRQSMTGSRSVDSEAPLLCRRRQSAHRGGGGLSPQPSEASVPSGTTQGCLRVLTRASRS